MVHPIIDYIFQGMTTFVQEDEGLNAESADDPKKEELSKCNMYYQSIFLMILNLLQCVNDLYFLLLFTVKSLQHHLTMEFFEMCSNLILALAR